MNNNNKKSIIISSLFWKLLERGGTQGVQFIVQLILARILVPEDYGIIALISIFINIANVFVQSGFSVALIQKTDANDEDFSSVFFISILVAGLLYAILYLTAPFISYFYGMTQLIKVLRVLSITLFFGAFNSIQNSIISRNMQFKKLFFSSLGSILVSGLIGIVLAYNGFGVWALVAQQLINQIMITIILFLLLKWRPLFIFSFNRIRELFSFGWKILVSSLIDTLYMNLRSLIIGKIYSPAILGYYNRGDQFPQIIVSNINGSIQSVMLPALSAEQNNKQKVKEMVRRSIITSSFLIFPLMIGLAVIAEPLVKLLLTDKWLMSVPFIKIFCFSYALWPIHTANLQAINALGRSDIYLRLEIIKKITGIVILLISISYGVYAIAWGSLINGIISTFLNAYPNIKLLKYGYKEQLQDILPSLFISLLMGVIVNGVNIIKLPLLELIIVQVIIGVFVYIGAAKAFKLESYNYLITTIKQIVYKK